MYTFNLSFLLFKSKSKVIFKQGHFFLYDFHSTIKYKPIPTYAWLVSLTSCRISVSFNLLSKKQKGLSLTISYCTCAGLGHNCACLCLHQPHSAAGGLGALAVLHAAVHPSQTHGDHLPHQLPAHAGTDTIPVK